MTQVADRVALPLRVHDILLALAGRLDDDALTEARALLAATEVDRVAELVAGCLVAGTIPVSADERADLIDMVTLAHGDTALLDGLAVGGGAVRHRFTDGRTAQQPADAGVLDALHPVLDALPDLAAVWCVWRTTPAGATPGPVPQRVVLVEIGSGGYPPATAYRVEHALGRAGITATVEVHRVDGPRDGYHADAMLHAIRLDLGLAASSSMAGSSSGSSGSSSSSSSSASARSSVSASAGSSRSSSAGSSVSSASDEPSWRSEQVSTDPTPPSARSSAPQAPSMSSMPRPQVAALPPVPPAGPSTDSVSGPPPVPPETPAETTTTIPPTPAVGAEPDPADAEESYSFRSKSDADEPYQPPSWQSGGGDPEPPGGESALNDQERDLLRQLHEELAKREQTTDQGDQTPPRGSSWPTAQHTGPHRTFPWPKAGQGPHVVNGVPPKPTDHPPFPQN